MKKRLVITVLLLMITLLTISSVSAQAVTVSPGHNPAAIMKGAVRLRNLVNPGGLTGAEIYVGNGNLSGPVQADFYQGAACDGTRPYGSWRSTNHVVFEYDPTTGILKATVGANPTYCPQYNLGNVGALNYLKIDVVNRKAGVTTNFMNVTLNGNALGDFVGSGWSTWQVTGLDFTNGFVIEGDLELGWPTPPPTSGNEENKVELSVGYLAPPTPGINPVTNTPLICEGDEATVNINFADVVNLFGYQFEINYDATVVSATGAFINSFFDTSTNAAIPPSWNASCAGGVCKFSVSKLDPGLPVSGSGTVAAITFTGLAAGEFNVTVSNDILSDRDANRLTHTVGGPLHMTVCGYADVSGVVSLQGRATPMDSGTVTLTDLGGHFPPYSASFDATTGAYSISDVKVLPGGSNYQFDATHLLYLGNRMTHILNPGDNYTAPSTRLLGGDADNSGLIDVSDLSCIGGAFGGTPTICGTDGSNDINADGIVNILDLVLPGGNYGLATPRPW